MQRPKSDKMLPAALATIKNLIRSADPGTDVASLHNLDIARTPTGGTDIASLHNLDIARTPTWVPEVASRHDLGMR